MKFGYDMGDISLFTKGHFLEKEQIPNYWGIFRKCMEISWNLTLNDLAFLQLGHFVEKCNVDWRVQAFEHRQVHAFCKCLSFTHPNPNSSFSFRWTELVQLNDEYDEVSSCKNMQLISTYSKAYIAMWYHVFILTFDQVHLCLRFWVIFYELGFL